MAKERRLVKCLHAPALAISDAGRKGVTREIPAGAALLAVGSTRMDAAGAGVKCSSGKRGYQAGLQARLRRAIVARMNWPGRRGKSGSSRKTVCRPRRATDHRSGRPGGRAARISRPPRASPSPERAAKGDPVKRCRYDRSCVRPATIARAMQAHRRLHQFFFRAVRSSLPSKADRQTSLWMIPATFARPSSGSLHVKASGMDSFFVCMKSCRPSAMPGSRGGA